MATAEPTAGPMRTCPSCNGSGREFDRDASGGHFTDCKDCHGSGEVRDLAKKALEREAAAGSADPGTTGNT